MTTAAGARVSPTLEPSATYRKIPKGEMTTGLEPEPLCKRSSAVRTSDVTNTYGGLRVGKNKCNKGLSQNGTRPLWKQLGKPYTPSPITNQLYVQTQCAPPHEDTNVPGVGQSQSPRSDKARPDELLCPYGLTSPTCPTPENGKDPAEFSWCASHCQPPPSLQLNLRKVYKPQARPRSRSPGVSRRSGVQSTHQAQNNL